MSEVKIKSGDVVRLKSGGPKMTANLVPGYTNLWECQWFDGAELKCQKFSGIVLEVISD